MTELKSYLIEKNISVKEFAKITKVKEKKLNRVLDNQAFFSGDEAARVSAFLGVSKNELYHGVVERKGELPEVAEQNNLNHFRYYIKNRFKNARRFAGFLDFIYGCGIFATVVLYIVGMFTSITGLPTLLRSIDTMLLGFLIPVIFIEYFWITAFNKVLKKRSVKGHELKTEGICISVLVLINAIICFSKDFIPVEAFAFSVVGAISLAILSVKSLFKTKPFTKRFFQFFVCFIPTAFLIVSSVFTEKYLEKLTPEGEEVLTDSLSGATAIMGLVFYLIILGVFCYSLMLFYNIFIEGAGQKFKPMKKEKALCKKWLVIHTLSSLAVCCAIFLGICASQGLYLKYMYTNMFDGQEKTVNWTSEYVTEYETRYKKGEYDVVKYNGIKLEVPEGYKLNRKTDETITYKKGDNSYLILSTVHFDEKSLELFDNDFGEGKITEKQKKELKEDFIKYFGVYPTTMYEWQKLYGNITLDDVNILNPKKTALMSSIFIMKSICTVPDSRYYLYENGELYATILIHTINNEEKGTTNEMVDIGFGSTALEYNITLVRPAEEGDRALEDVIKILNSINFD